MTEETKKIYEVGGVEYEVVEVEEGQEVPNQASAEVSKIVLEIEQEGEKDELGLTPEEVDGALKKLARVMAQHPRVFRLDLLREAWIDTGPEYRLPLTKLGQLRYEQLISPRKREIKQEEVNTPQSPRQRKSMQEIVEDSRKQSGRSRE